MNRISTNILATLIVIVVAFFLGRLIMLAGLQTELDQAKNGLIQANQSLKLLEGEVNNIKSAAKAEKVPQSSKILKAGEESSLLRVIGETAGKSFRLNSFDLLESFMIKPEATDETNRSAPGFSAVSEELPQLDEQGMPVGLAAEDDQEWPGVEVIPVKMTFASTYRTVGKFLSEAEKNMPVNAVRSMDLMIRDGGLVKGTLVMTFPLSEQSKR